MGASKIQAGRKAGWLGGLLILAFSLGLAQPSNAQGAVRSVHGDWQIRCDTPPGAQAEQCALIQSVVAEDRSNAGLTVIVLKTADQKSRLMRVVAPLGVLLPSGLGLKLDNQDVGRAGFCQMPAQWLRRRGRDGRQAARPDQERQDRDVHYFRDPGRRYRVPAQPERPGGGV